MTETHVYWYLSRASGLTALLLLAAATAMGFALSGGLRGRRIVRWLNPDLHQYVSLLALGFIAFHVLVLLGDHFSHFTLLQLLVPFALPYRRQWTGLGSLALWAGLLTYGSLYLRGVIGYRGWRIIHYLTPLPLALAVVHGLAAGSDTAAPWARILVPAAGAAPLALLAYRLPRGIPAPAGPRQATPARAAAVTLTLIGGGSALLAAAAMLAPSAPTALSSLAALLVPSHPTQVVESLDGRVDQTQDGAGATLTIDARAQGDLPLHLVAQVVFQRSDAGENEGGEAPDNESAELQVVGNSVNVSDADNGISVCQGQLTALEGNYLALTCDGSYRRRAFSLQLAGTLRVLRDGSLSGTMSGDLTESG